MISRALYFFGVWEPNLSTFISQRLSAGDTFIDVGANIGYYSLLASPIVGEGGHVVAIEASPGIFSMLESNLRLNAVRNVRAVHIAVSDRDGVLELYGGRSGNIGETSIIEQPGLKVAGSVHTKPLPSILSSEELLGARLFKVDVEGAEWLVVKGLESSLSRTHPAAEFVVEVSPKRLASHGRTADDIIKIFENAGFNPYTLSNDYNLRTGGYLNPLAYERPTRLTGLPSRDIDIIFSRADAEVL